MSARLPQRALPDGTTAAWLSLALVSAVVLRFWGLFGDANADEVWTLWVAGKPFWKILPAAAQDWVHPPGYYFALRAWFALAGEGMPALRVFSALCGVLAVWLVYRLGGRLGSPRAGVRAALLTAWSSTLVWHAQLGRSYALTVVLALWFLERVLAWLRRPTARRAALLAIAMTALVLTHYFGWLLVIGATAWVWRSRAVVRRSWLMLVAIAGLGTLAWGLYVLPVALARGSGAYAGWIARPDFGDLAHAVAEFHGLAGAAWLQMLAAIGWLVPLIWWWRDRRGRPAIGWLLLLATVPVGLLWSLSYVALPVFVPRYVLMCLPLYYVGLTLAVESVPDRRAAQAWFAAVLLWSAWGCATLIRHIQRLPTEAAATYIARWPASIPILVERTYLMNPFWMYLHGAPTLRVFLPNHTLVAPRERVITLEQLPPAMEIGTVVFGAQSERDVAAALGPSYAPVERRVFTGYGQERQPQGIIAVRYRRLPEPRS